MLGEITYPLGALDYEVENDPPCSENETIALGHDQGTDRSDELLLAQVSNGAKDALSILFHRYARMVRSSARRILRNSAEADDLVQEVFLFVFQKAHLFDPSRGSTRTWLVQVAYHRAIDRRRSLASRGFYTQLDIEEATLGKEELLARGFNYDDTIEAALGREVLDRIETNLSEVQRRVLDLRFVDSCTINEIAGLLGQSAGNIRNHYYRALERIRRELFGRRASSK